jgi:4a-hydroxytetrahydrobiopterin dehydratase
MYTMRRGGLPFDKEQAEKYLAELSGWLLDEKETGIFKEYKFKDFLEAINFVNKIAKIAEEEGHHPDIHVFYNKVLLNLSTHSIGGLSENDFILVTKIDAR